MKFGVLVSLWFLVQLDGRVSCWNSGRVGFADSCERMLGRCDGLDDVWAGLEHAMAVRCRMF